jgi:excisionase family DNA binding protein
MNWLTVPEVAEALRVEVTRVRQLLREGTLLATRRGGDGPLMIPADFVQEGEVLTSLPGVITLLRDAGYSDEEALDWLYRPDDTLPGTPVHALAENRGTEVKRRAQALGF